MHYHLLAVTVGIQVLCFTQLLTQKKLTVKFLNTKCRCRIQLSLSFTYNFHKGKNEKKIERHLQYFMCKNLSKYKKIWKKDEQQKLSLSLLVATLTRQLTALFYFPQHSFTPPNSTIVQCWKTKEGHTANTVITILTNRWLSPACRYLLCPTAAFYIWFVWKQLLDVNNKSLFSLRW